MDRRRLGLAIGALAAAPWLARSQASDALAALVAGPQRSAANRARDRYRHPLETLRFWGLAPGMTVIEIEPSGGYWTEIIAPYLRATGGHYIGAVPRDPAAFLAHYADRAVFGAITAVPFGASSPPLAPAGSADMVMTARNIHDWLWTQGMTDKVFADFAAALKRGGILAVEEHRADPRPQIGDARDGYVATANVVAMARKAGFRLDGSSEVNANPRDTKDYPFGVWTLPPTLRDHTKDKPTPPGYDRARYEAIGESDRMTLRFRKA